jgi:hypothetical protein
MSYPLRFLAFWGSLVVGAFLWGRLLAQALGWGR